MSNCLRQPALRAALADAGIDPASIVSVDQIEAMLNEALAWRDAILAEVAPQVAVQTGMAGPDEIAAETQQQQANLGARETDESEGDPGDQIGLVSEPKPLDIVLPLSGTAREKEDLAQVVSAVRGVVGDMVDNFEAYEDDTGHLHVRMDLRAMEDRAPDTNARVIEEVVKLLRNGMLDSRQTKEASKGRKGLVKVHVEDMNNRTGKAGSGRKLRLDGAQLAVLGRMLSPNPNQPNTRAVRKQNVMTAVAWLDDRGIRLRRDNEWAQEKVISGGLPLPDKSIIGVSKEGEPILWEDVKDASDDYATNQELFVGWRESRLNPEMSRREILDLAVADEQKMRDEAHKASLKIEQLRKEHEDKRMPREVIDQIADLYRTVRQNERMANVLRDEDFIQTKGDPELDGLIHPLQDGLPLTVGEAQQMEREQEFIGAGDTMGVGVEYANENLTNAEQQEDEARVQGGAVKPQQVDRGRTERETYGYEDWIDHTKGKLNKVLQKIRLGNVFFQLVSRTGLNQLAEQYLAPPPDAPPDTVKTKKQREDWNKRIAAWREAVRENEAAINALRSGEVVARMLTLRRPSDAQRSTPIIFISDMVEPKARPRVLMHEMGHLVLAHMLQSLGPARLRQLADDLGATSMADFHERFAELFAAWYFGGQNAAAFDVGVAKAFVEGSRLAKGPRKNFVISLFKDIVRDLRALYREMKRVLAAEAAPAFNGWMRKWLQGYDRATPELPTPVISRYLNHDPAGVEFADFTPIGEAVRNAANKAARGQRARRLAAAAGRFKQHVARPIFQATIQSADSFLRANGLTWLADATHRRPGEAQQVVGPTMEHEVMAQAARWQQRLDAIVEQYWPKWRPFSRRPEEPQILKDAREMLHGRMTADPNNKVYAELRKLYDEMFVWLVDNGINVKPVKDYFPVVYSTVKIIEGQKAFIEAVAEGAREWNAVVEAQARQVVDQGQAAVEHVLKARIENPQDYAEYLYRRMSADPSMLDTTEGLDMAAPGFPHKHSRTLPDQIRQRLGDFMEDDIVTTTMAYIGGATKRVGWQKRFGLNDVLDDINSRFDRGDNAAALEYRDRIQQEYEFRYNVNIYDPSAGLKVRLLDDLRAERITQEVYDRVTTKLIPAYLGRLGADMYPTLKRMSALAILYQNLRLLAFGVLSQFVDVGTVGARAGDIGLFGSEIARLMRGADRRDMTAMAKAIGTIRDDMMEHVLNDASEVMGSFKWTRNANNAFFRWNGMQAATNLMRAAALSIGRQVIQQSAARGPNDAEAVKQLAVIGLSPARAKAWVDAGMPMDAAQEQWADVYGALNQFVDESVVRPTPATRPLWGSDQRFAVLWHLKSFMWAYHEAIFRRVWAEGKQAKGLARALPFLTLAAFTLPLAALGMELRWLLAPPKMRPEGGWEYFMEMVQRSGLLGLYQMWADFDDSEDYGRLAILSAAGPTIGQLEEITTKDFDYWAPRALPLRPVFQTLDNFFGGQ